MIESKPPLFIIGNPRSGTTLFRLMVTCHGSITIPPECGFAVWYQQKYADWGEKIDREGLITEFVDDVLNSRKFETWKLSRFELLEFLQAANPANYSGAVAAVYRCYANRFKSTSSRWGDKNNFHIDHIAEIDRMFPDARFLHIVRDGRSVACSYRGLHAKAIDSRYAPQLPSEISEIASQWSGNIEKVGLAFSQIDRLRILEVRFEDLIADPEGQLRTVCEFLREAFDPDMLRYHELNGQQELEPKEFWRWKEKNLSPPMNEEIDRYKRELDNAEIREFVKIARGALERYGYPL